MYIQKYLQIVHFTSEKNSFNTCCMHRVTSFTCAIHRKCLVFMSETPAYQPYFDNVYIFHDVKTDLFFKACVRYFLSNFIFSPNDSPLKTEKYFLFHLKSSFRSRDIQIFLIFSLSLHNFQIQKDKWK